MAHLWIHRRDAWEVLPLERGCITLLDVHRAAQSVTGPVPLGALYRTGPDRDEWHLVTDPGADVAVNGIPVRSGLRTLADRDEIRVAGSPRWLFSSERLAAIEPLPALGREVSCPRCRQRIDSGAPAVRCPGCELWHHQSEALPCWTYAPTCAVCAQSTAEHAGFRWTPESC